MMCWFLTIFTIEKYTFWLDFMVYFYFQSYLFQSINLNFMQKYKILKSINSSWQCSIVFYVGCRFFISHATRVMKYEHIRYVLPKFVYFLLIWRKKLISTFVQTNRFSLFHFKTIYSRLTGDSSQCVYMNKVTSHFLEM